MSEHNDPASDLRANRRKEVFRVLRGSKLTAQRGKWSADSTHAPGAESRKAVADDEPQPLRRVRLGGVVEDETGAVETREPRRYSEPND
jgi:hypothetical protein